MATKATPPAWRWLKRMPFRCLQSSNPPASGSIESAMTASDSHTLFRPRRARTLMRVSAVVWRLLGVALVATCPPVAAQQATARTVDTNRIGQAVDAWMQQHRAPALSIAIALDGKPTWSAGFGFANPERGIVGLVDDLLAVCQKHGLELAWEGDRCRVRSAGGEWEEMMDIPLRKSVLRAILARIAALCNEQLANSVSPNGGEGQISTGRDSPHVFRISFANTPSEQKLELATHNRCTAE